MRLILTPKQLLVDDRKQSSLWLAKSLADFEINKIAGGLLPDRVTGKRRELRFGRPMRRDRFPLPVLPNEGISKKGQREQGAVIPTNGEGKRGEIFASVEALAKDRSRFSRTKVLP